MSETILATRLHELERTIERGLTTFVEVGTALMEIRDARLYRETHPTFEAYCQERWGWTRQHAYKYLEAAEVAENVASKRQTASTTIATCTTCGKMYDASAWDKSRSGYECPYCWKDSGKTLSLSHSHLLAPLSPAEQQILAPQIADLTVREAREVVAQHRNSAGLPHVAQNTGRSEWYTPKEIIEAARSTMGGIDLDVATHVEAQSIVQASRYYTEQDDGLRNPWSGRVWMNPPYSQPLIAQFCGRLVSEWESRRIEQAITLTNNGTETEWGQSLMRHATAICFPAGRVTFWAPDRESVPLQGQMLCYFGQRVKAFHEQFTDMGIVLTVG